MEAKTVTALAELFGVSRQAMNNRVKQMPESFLDKNESGITVVTLEGIRYLETIYNKAVMEPEASPLSGDVVSLEESQKNLVQSLLKDKNTEIARLVEQLEVKDQQITLLGQQLINKDKQLDQQLQLTAQALENNSHLQLELKAEQEQQRTETKKGFFARLRRK